MAFLLKVYGPISHRNLHYINKIRNKFAHWVVTRDSKREIEQLTFASQDVKAWVSELKSISNPDHPVPVEFRVFPELTGDVEARKKFTVICTEIIMELFLDVSAVEGQAENRKTPP